MGCILDSCEYTDGEYLEIPICYSAKAIFIINIFFFMKVAQQIFLYHKKKDRFLTRKLFLFYLILIEITSNTIYSGIRAWIQFYLLDIAFRHFVFIYLIYFFGRKLMTLMESATPIQKKSPTFLSIISALYFFGLLLYGFVDNSQESSSASCKDNFWVYLRVGGLIAIFLFIVVGVILINRHKESYEANAEFTMIIKYTSEVNPGSCSYNELEKSMIEQNIENMLVKDEKNYNIWLIMGTHFFSAILCLTTTVFRAINSDSSDKNCGFYPFEKDLTNDLTAVTLLGWAFYFINYFIPLVIILRVFLYKEIQLPIRGQNSFSEPEEFPYHENLRVKGHNPALNFDKSKSSNSSSMNIDFDNSSKKSFEEQKFNEEEEEEKKDWKEETRSSGFL